VVPVPWAEPVVGAWRAQHDWAARLGVPAHITIMGPFLKPASIDPDVSRRLAAIFGAIQKPLSFSLSRLERRGDVAFLVPTPNNPFERLSAAIREEWPELRPYGDAFDQVRFHLTVARGCDRPLFVKLIRAVEQQLPLSGAVREAMLVVQNSPGAVSMTVFRLEASGMHVSAQQLGSQMGSSFQ
jgi:hypothetical protein